MLEEEAAEPGVAVMSACALGVAKEAACRFAIRLSEHIEGMKLVRENLRNYGFVFHRHIQARQAARKSETRRP